MCVCVYVCGGRGGGVDSVNVREEGQGGVPHTAASITKIWLLICLKIEAHPKLLISQSKYSGPRKFTLRYQ